MRLPRGFDKVLRKNRNGTTCTLIRARVYKYDAADKRRRVSAYGSTLDDVKRKVEEVKRRSIASFDAGKQTLQQYLESWLSKVERDCSRRTHDLYSDLVRRHVTPHLGALRLGRLRPKDIRDLLDRTLLGVGSRTRQLVYRVIHSSLDCAVLEELIPANPCLKQLKPKHSYAEFRSLTREEAQRLLAAAKDGKYFTLIYLALATGMRQGELFGLRWPAVNIEHCFVSVEGTLTKGKDGRPALQPPKGGRSRRIDISAY